MSPAKNGVLFIRKPEQITSSDLVLSIRKRIHEKVGHTGTLDKFASGLMILLTGSAAPFSEVFLGMDKSYRAGISFGTFTDTHDPAGIVTDRRSPEETRRFFIENRERIESEIARFTAETEQIPPLYSALKKGGRRHSDLARAGATELPAKRSIRIDVSRIESFDPEAGRLDALFSVSSGTYIRSIVRDLSERLGFPAHLQTLVRLSIGPYTLDAPSVCDPDGELHLLPIGSLLPWPRFVLTAPEVERVLHGQRLPYRAGMEQPNFLFVNGEERVVAWGAGEEGRYRYRRVFPAEGI